MKFGLLGMNWTMELTNEITGVRIRVPIYGFVLRSGIRLKVGVVNTNYRLDYWISNKGPDQFLSVIGITPGRVAGLVTGTQKWTLWLKHSDCLHPPTA